MNNYKFVSIQDSCSTLDLEYEAIISTTIEQENKI